LRVDLQELAGHGLARLTTIGRRTGMPREVELYFVYRDGRFYFLAHRDSQWYRNLMANPEAQLRVGGALLQLKATRIDSGPELVEEVMDMFREKYGDRQVAYWYQGTQRFAVEAEVIGTEAL
jgi:deazaflavin-dependent oxidoreductase (nitroreductase family)